MSVTLRVLFVLSALSEPLSAQGSRVVDAASFEVVPKDQKIGCVEKSGPQPGDRTRQFEIRSPSWLTRTIVVELRNFQLVSVLDMFQVGSTMVTAAARRSATGQWQGFHQKLSVGSSGLRNEQPTVQKRPLTREESPRADQLVADLLTRPCSSR